MDDDGDGPNLLCYSNIGFFFLNIFIYYGMVSQCCKNILLNVSSSFIDTQTGPV